MSAQPSIREEAVRVALAFLMAESKRGHSTTRRQSDMKLVMRLRDSLIYRAESVLWHPQLVELVTRSADRRLREVYPDRAKEHLLLLQIGAEVFYAFDDLVFNALSLFDYVGNFVGFAFYGEQRRKAKWDRIQHFARDAAYEKREHSHPRISGSALGSSILEVHKTLVESLTEYRAALIHYEALVGLGEVKTEYGAGETPKYDLSFTVPKEFAKVFTVTGYKQDPAKAPVVEGAKWLAQECTRQALRVLIELRRALRVEAEYTPDGTDGAVEMIC